jgi:hypothetical protein
VFISYAHPDIPYIVLPMDIGEISPHFAVDYAKVDPDL